MTDQTTGRRVFLIAGSPSASPPRSLRPAIGDVVIAADSGIGHALAWGWPVDLAVGDMDSVAAADLEQIERRGVPIVRVPTAKDETDLELALLHALELDPSEIVVCGALGGRTDHLLANILLLARADLRGRNVCLQDSNQTISLLRGGTHGRLQLVGQSGDLLSLLPIGGDVLGVTTSGLTYPLDHETLFLGAARGMSNVFQDDIATVSADEGTLLVIHTYTALGSTGRRGSLQ